MAQPPLLSKNDLEEDIPVIDAAGMIRLVRGLDFVDTAASAPPKPPVPPKTLPPAAKRETFQTVTAVEEKEIAEIAKVVPQKVETRAVENVILSLEQAVEKSVDICGVACPTDDLKNRFKNLVSLYFRDLRDALETKSKLTMAVGSGGMGMIEAEAERVMTLLKQKAVEFRESEATRLTQEKERFVAEQTEKVAGAAVREEKQEAETLERRLEQLLEKTGISVPGAAAKEPKEPATTAPPPVNLPAAPPGPPRVIPVVAVKEGAVSGAAGPRPLTPAPRQQYQAEARPFVADVKAVHKLVGPIDELKAMNLMDFRRLSKDPREAILKIKDKIDLLENQSFEAKTKGIKAWQESDANKMYLDVLHASLEGKPVAEVLAEAQAKGTPTLSKDEFEAIMELNRQLRFG